MRLQKSRLRLTPPCQCRRSGRVQSAFLRSQWFGSIVSLSVRYDYACLSSPDILGCYRLARRASVDHERIAQARAGIAFLLRLAPQYARDIDGWAKLMLEGFDGDCRLP